MAGCASCGAEPLRVGARFCDSCGAPLHAAATAEFKQVTVLFADVVRSMDIAAAVGAERLREIMAELVRRAAQVVHRYGGTVDKFTGDGLMAVFGAPVALEDHAVRAGLAALGIQAAAGDLAAELRRRDGIILQLRVGLNSGQVIAGEIGSGAPGYTAIGEQVGLAQRMEAAAEPGTVMVSESTAALLARAAGLGEAQWVAIKGVQHPVPAHRLLTMEPRHEIGGGDHALVGRGWEMTALTGILNRALDGRGGAVGVVGPPGIGKSRLAREAAATAVSRGMGVVWTFCQSHTADVPFAAVTQLLGTALGLDGLDGAAARAVVRQAFPDAADDDLGLFADLLGIADPEAPAPDVAADARRRRLTAMVNAATLSARAPVLYVIEDAHWMDEVSESMLADFFTVLAQSPTMVLLTYRPEYTGTLTTTPAMVTIALAPLHESETAALIDTIAGRDASLSRLTRTIVANAGGNPFFAEEMIRDLAERGVLTGQRGRYACPADGADVTVPATLQATISARIDRLSPQAKRTLSAAAVIGSRFDAELLPGLGVTAEFDELLRAELIDQVRFTPVAEYAFRHSLIRTVAYEAQLKSHRAQAHRQLAAAIADRDPAAQDDNAALIAEHLEAAGDLTEAYAWQMRAGAWSVRRDVTAARVSWERAAQIADRLPRDTDTAPLRIAPRAMLCASIWRGSREPVSAQFEELRQLCAQIGDDESLVVGLFGLAAEHMFHGRMREAAQVAASLIDLLEALGFPDSTVGVAFLAIGVKGEIGEFNAVVELADHVIDWAAGDPNRGNLIAGSPLAIALVWRAAGRWSLGQPGWRADLADAVTMARGADPGTYAMVVGVKCGGVSPGVLAVDDELARELEDALRTVEGITDDTSLGSLRFGAGDALAQHRDPVIRRRGVELLEEFVRMCRHGRFFASELAIAEACLAREVANSGDADAAIPVLRRCLDELERNLQVVNLVAAAHFLVTALLQRGGPGDMVEAALTVDRLAAAQADEPWVLRDVMVLRLRALLARARGDIDYPELLQAYRAAAQAHDFQGHLVWAERLQATDAPGGNR